MNAPTYPEAVHSAEAIPRIRSTPAVPRLFVRPSIGPWKVCAAEAGPIELTSEVISLVMVCGSPTSPTIATSANSAGKIDRIA